MIHKFSSLSIGLLISGLMLLAAGSINVAAGATLYVSTTGNDSNNCLSPAAACLTVQAAVNKAPDGSIINIAAGTYPGLIQINNRKQITLKGAPSTRLVSPTGTTDTAIIGIIFSQGIGLENLTLSGNIPNGVGGVRINSSRVSLSQCTVEDGSGGVTIFRDSNVDIDDSIIQRNQFHGVRVDVSSIVSLLGAPFSTSTTVVQDNLFAGVIVNGGSLAMLGAITIQGNQIGITADGGSVSSCCAEDGVERKFLNNIIGIQMKGGHLSLRGPALVAGNTQWGITLVGTTAIFNRFGNARVAVRDNAAGIIAIGSHVDLFYVDATNNTGGGVVIRDTSSARVFGSVISNNGDVGMLVERLSAVELLSDVVMENNRGKDLSCKLKSLGHGDKSGVRRMSCPGFGRDEDE